MADFRFKQFTIRQDRCAMKVGTDGVLLGAWTAVQPADVCLDVGAGTGLISLMLAQRLAPSPFHIDAVEVDAEATQQAAENVASSPWSEHITLHHSPLQSFQPQRQYTLIVSNPPFYNATLKPTDPARAAARHKDALPIAHIFSFARTHLTPTGRVALIFPAAYEGEVLQAAVLTQFHLIRICRVSTKQSKPVKRVLAEFSPQASHQPLTQTLCIHQDDGSYTPHYRQLTSPYYLNL